MDQLLLNKKTLSSLIIIFLSFFLLKLSFWPAALIYPYFIYFLLKRHSLKNSVFLLFFIGCIYFFTLFLWFTTTGIELNIIGGFVSGTIFALSGLIFKLIEKHIYPKIPLVSSWDLIMWPVSFYVVQHTLFPLLFVDATYLLDVPPFLPLLYAYIGSGGVHVLLASVSIWFGHSFNKRSVLSMKLSGCMVLLLLFSQALFVFLPEKIISTEGSALVALVQVNNTEEIQWKRDNADLTFAKYKEDIISSAEQGADIIVLPENAILFWSEKIQKYPTLVELENISREHDAYIIFSTIEMNEDNKLQSTGYVIDPIIGTLEPYIAQKTYDYIGGVGSFALGTETVLYPTKFGVLRLLICFEALFRDELKSDNTEDYDHIIVMANNQFLPSHNGLKTLEWNAQDIAGTFKKDVLYASNNGPTMHANKYGKILKSLPYDTENILWTRLESSN